MQEYLNSSATGFLFHFYFILKYGGSERIKAYTKNAHKEKSTRQIGHI